MAAVAAGAWLLDDGRRGADASESTALRPEPRPRDAAVDPRRTDGPAPAPAPAPAPLQRSAQPEAPPRPLTEGDFRGRGSIRGDLVLTGGVRLPETWAVVVGPSRTLMGRERAETRQVEYPSSETSFELEGLPLGGYDVRVEGQGLSGNRVPVLLVRGSEHVFVNVAVHPSGLLDGALLDEDGSPVEGVLVVLEEQGSGERFAATTSPAGMYIFPDLPDGEYEIHFGGVTHPLIAPEELSFRAPSMRFPTRRVPQLGTLILHTLDRDGAPLAGAVVQGFSASGGLIDVRSDDLGLARIPSLRPGRYRLSVRHEESGSEARSTVEIVGGAEEELRLALTSRE